MKDQSPKIPFSIVLLIIATVVGAVFSATVRSQATGDQAGGGSSFSNVDAVRLRQYMD